MTTAVTIADLIRDRRLLWVYCGDCGAALSTWLRSEAAAQRPEARSATLLDEAKSEYIQLSQHLETEPGPVGGRTFP
jgi:hypothetical protein